MEKLIQELEIGVFASDYSLNYLPRTYIQPFLESHCATIQIHRIRCPLKLTKVIIVCYINNTGFLHKTKIHNKKLLSPLILNNYSCYSKFSIHLLGFINDEFVYKGSLRTHICLLRDFDDIYLESSNFLQNESQTKASLIFEFYNLKSLHYLYESPPSAENVVCFYYQKIFLFSNFECIFCFKPFTKIDHLILHINNSHLRFNCKMVMDTIYINTETPMEYTRSLKFCNKTRKIDISKESKFPYSYFQPETFHNLNAKHTKPNFITFFNRNKTDEIIDLSEKHKVIINSFNQLNLTRESLIEGLKTLKNEFGGVDFLEILMAIKCTGELSDKDMCSLLVDEDLSD